MHLPTLTKISAILLRKSNYQQESAVVPWLEAIGGHWLIAAKECAKLVMFARRKKDFTLAKFNFCSRLDSIQILNS